MGLFHQHRFTRRIGLGIDVAQRDARPIRDHYRGAGETRALIFCSLAAAVSLGIAVVWPFWLTIHCCIILCGLSLAIYCAPWFADRDSPSELARDQLESHVTPIELQAPNELLVPVEPRRVA